MPVIDSFVRRVRRSGPNPVTQPNYAANNAWTNWRYGGGVAPIREEAALGLTAVYRAASMIASTVGAMPIHIYEQQPDNNRDQIYSDDTMYLWLRPNVEMTRINCWELAVGHETLNGNAFLWVDKDAKGEPRELWPVAPQRVRVGRATNGQKVYLIDDLTPMIDYKNGGEIVHIPNWSTDGLIGLSPIQQAANAIYLGLEAEGYANRFFAQESIPRGVLSTDQVLTPEDSDRIQARWEQRYSGQQGQHRTAVLGNGAKFQQISINPEDAQLIAERSFQVSEIARIFGVPPHLLGDLEKSTSWGSGLEEQNRAFYAFTLNAHVTRFELAITDELLRRELTGRYCKFDPGALLRGSTLQRYQAYATGWGRWLTTNDIRRDEDMSPVQDGDILMQPLNMAPLDAFPNQPASAGQEGL